MKDYFEQSRLWFSTSAPVIPMRRGAKFVAAFDDKVEKMEIRNGRLVVKVAGIWHIVPVPKP